MTDVLEIVEGYETGSETRESVMSKLADLCATRDVQSIVDALPEGWRRSFEEWARALYGNDRPIDDFFQITNGTPDPEAHHRSIRALRAWLQPCSIPRTSGELTP